MGKTRNRTDEELLENENTNTDDDAVLSSVDELRKRRRERRGEGFSAAVPAKANSSGEAAAPSRRAAERASSAPQPNIFQRIPIVRPIYNYLAESVEELQKVTWPSQEETNRLTRMVITFTIFSAIGLGAFDLFYGWWFRQALEDVTLFLGLGAVVSVVGLVFTYFFFIKPDEISNF